MNTYYTVEIFPSDKKRMLIVVWVEYTNRKRKVLHTTYMYNLAPAMNEWTWAFLRTGQVPNDALVFVEPGVGR